jgi:hypothetical protein
VIGVIVGAVGVLSFCAGSIFGASFWYLSARHASADYQGIAENLLQALEQVRNLALDLGDILESIKDGD